MFATSTSLTEAGRKTQRRLYSFLLGVLNDHPLPSVKSNKFVTNEKNVVILLFNSCKAVQGMGLIYLGVKRRRSVV